jgi:hypothetical protein
MPRISIDVSPEQHQCLKAVAALQGLSIKEYVLKKTLPPQLDEAVTGQEALEQLAAFLKPRIEAAERGERSRKTFDQIKQEARTKP